MFVRSPSGIAPGGSGSAVFMTARLSPVSIASLTVRSRAETMRASAGTSVPRRRVRRSPGTTDSSPTSAGVPSLITQAVCSAAVPRPLMVRSERRSTL